MEIIVGAFMVMVLLGLGYFTIILSRETWFSRSYGMEVRFDHVMGLREGDSVVVRGMPVGKVKTMRLEADGVHVLVSLDELLDMREGYKIRVMATSVLGGNHLSIDEGPEGISLPIDTVFEGQEPYDLIADAAEVVSAIREGLVDGKVIENLRVSVESLRTMIGRVHDGKGTLGRLLSEDDTLYRDLSQAVASLRAVAERLEKGEGTLGRLVSADDRTYEDLSAAIRSLREVAARIERGEGLLGRLVQDDALYTELEGTVKEVRAAVDDFRESSPVVTFTSIFFGAF
jgi:phospholipid/cholesterol/gamma-HCH transport system substrate-binding protein